MLCGWIFSLLFNLFGVYNAQDCNVMLRYPAHESPLFPTDDSRTVSGSPHLMTELVSYLLYPDILNETTQRLTVTRFQTIACPGSKNGIINTNKHLAIATCGIKGLILDGDKAPFKEFGCKKQPVESILRSEKKCYGNREGVLHSIGWQITPKWFVPQITVCWDPLKETTIYTRHVIYGSALKKRMVSPGRPSFKVGKLFSKRITQLYSKNSQSEKLRALLGAIRGIPGTGTYFFARGHLAPDADFVLPAEQDSTYFYLNVVPQFQTLNNGNWKSVENSIRKLAEDKERSLVVYTGTMETLQLKDVNGKKISIYLYPSDELYPVPKVIWKVVHDPLRKEAVAILGLNFVQKDSEVLESFFRICDDVCHSLKWSSWEAKNWKKGSILCCNWNQFKSLVPKMLDLGKVNLLNK